MGALTTNFDLKLYARLLSKLAPRVIANSLEHERALVAVEALMEKGESKMSPEEDALLDLLTTLVETYENPSTPRLRNPLQMKCSHSSWSNAASPRRISGLC